MLNFQETLIITAISAIVALATSLVFRWWESSKVEWLVTGIAFKGYDHGRATGTNVARLEVHNVGDGDAYDVRLLRCNGGTYKPWETFEVGKLAAGESFAVTFDTKPEHFDSAWFEIIYQPTPVRRRKTTRSRRYQVGAIAGHVHDMPPSPRSREENQALGKRIAE